MELKDEFRAGQNATDMVDQAAADLLGVNRTDARCLDILDRLGRVTAGRLAEESGLTTGAVTAMIDRLERAGHVRRVRDEEDRRRVLVEVTPRTRRAAEKLYEPLSARWAAVSKELHERAARVPARVREEGPRDQPGAGGDDARQARGPRAGG